jgi:uncharacterized protein YndB with AHSA1/START domain
MSQLTRTVSATPDQVFAVLADGWTYSGWVVGCSHIRDVDPGFPAPGTRIHHSVGVWPALVEDTTSVVECDPEKKLVLDARVWPAGKAQVTFVLEPKGSRTAVTMEEHATAGPGRLLRNPLGDLALDKRNEESLARLFAMAMRRPPCVYPDQLGDR